MHFALSVRLLAWAASSLLGATVASALPAQTLGERQYLASLPLAAAIDPQAQPVPFSDLATPAQFISSLVFLDHPSLEQVGGLLQKTFAARDLKDGAIAFIASDLLPAQLRVANAQSAYDAFAVRIREAWSHADQGAKRSFVAGIAGTYLDDRLDELVKNQDLTPADKASAKKIWPAYCEAKLWELATNAQLGRTFASRPTPVQLCEAYYKEQHYFADADRCGPAADAAGKDFFACLWSDGVLKSPLFARQAEAPCLGSVEAPLKRGAALKSWLDAGVLKSILLGADADDADQLRNALLSNGFLARSYYRKHPQLAVCRNAFAKLSPTGSDDWAAYKPGDLLLIGEAADSAAGPFSLLPPAQDEAVNKRRYDGLVKGIKDFGSRANAARVSYSDATFNLVTGQALPLDPNTEAVLSADAGFTRLKDFEPAEVKALKAAQATSLLTLNAAKELQSTAQATYERNFKRAIDENLLATAAVAQQPGAAIYLNNFYVDLDKSAGQLRVKIIFDSATTALAGCINLADGTPCATGFTAEQALPVHLSFIDGLNLLSVDLQLANPAAVGFAPLPRQPGSIHFNEIAADQLVGRTLRLDMLIAQSATGVQTLTGAAMLLDDQAYPHYLGTGVGDDFAQRERSQLPTTR